MTSSRSAVSIAGGCRFCRAGEDRPQGHRRGTVPARLPPEGAGRRPLLAYRGGGLRQRRGRGRQRLPLPGAFCSGFPVRPPPRQKEYRRLIGRKAAPSPAALAEKGSQLGPEPLSGVPVSSVSPKARRFWTSTGVHPESTPPQRLNLLGCKRATISPLTKKAERIRSEQGRRGMRRGRKPAKLDIARS